MVPLVAADDELAQIVAKGLRDYGSLSEKERVRFVATFMAFLSYTQNAFLKWREGLLASPLWMGWELVIMNLVCAPGGKAFWKERGYMFGDEFRRYVESDLMKREPHPDAKPMGAFANRPGSRVIGRLLLVVCRCVFERLAVLVSSFCCYRAGLAIGCYDNASHGRCLVAFLDGELQRLRVNLLVRTLI